MSARLCPIRSFLRIAVALISAAAVFFPAGHTAAEEETLETVLAVWRKREAAAKSVKVVTAEDNSTAVGIGLEGEPIGGTAKTQRIAILEGANFRHEWEGEHTGPGGAAPEQVIMISVTDGHRGKDMTWVGRDGKMIRSNGWIRHREKHRDLNNTYLSPVLRHWRPVSPALEMFRLDSLKLASTKEKIGGVRCILLEEPYGMAGAIRKYWVAPDQDMAIIRMAASKGDALIHQTDVTFKHDDKLGWIPTSWKGSIFKRDGGVSSTATAIVIETKVNLDVPKETFDIVFPPGTKVWDSIAKVKSYVSLEK